MSQPMSFQVERARLWRPYLLVAVVLVSGAAITIAVSRQISKRARETDETRFHRLVQQSTKALQERLDKYQLGLQTLAEAATRPGLAPAEWRFRVRLMRPEERYPGLLELGCATLPDSSADDRQILQLAHSWVRPPSAADGISSQFLSDPSTVQMAKEAIYSGKAQVLCQRELSAEIGGNPARGFTLFVPAYENTSAAYTSSGKADPARHNPTPQVKGVVFGSIEPNLLMENLFGIAPREVEFDLFSSEPANPVTWLNTRGHKPVTLSSTHKPYLKTNGIIELHNQKWLASFYTTPLFERESPRNRPRTAAAIGCLITILISALLFTQIRGRLLQEAIAAELRSACEDLQQVQNERERIGRDLHDGAIQSLYGLQLSLGQLERLYQRNSETAGEVLRTCRAALDGLIAELRTFIVQHAPADEHPDHAANASAALQQLVHRFQSSTSVPIKLLLQDSPPTPITLDQQMHLRQIAQEAISNSLRHSRARHVVVALLRQEQQLQLRVTDDGAGFNPSQSHAGYGLANMQARSIQLGARLHIRSEPGNGTEITLALPLGAVSSHKNGKDSQD